MSDVIWIVCAETEIADDLICGVNTFEVALRILAMAQPRLDLGIRVVIPNKRMEIRTIRSKVGSSNDLTLIIDR